MPPDPIIVRMLTAADTAVFDHVAEDVFDDPLQPALVREFLADPRHHMAVALDGVLVVGMASGVHYIHPDKPAELFINEVGVATTHQRRGLGRRLVEELLRHAAVLGCVEAWVGTDVDNAPARALYQSAGGEEESPHTAIYWFPVEAAEHRDQADGS